MHVNTTRVPLPVYQQTTEVTLSVRGFWRNVSDLCASGRPWSVNSIEGDLASKSSGKKKVQCAQLLGRT